MFLSSYKNEVLEALNGIRLTLSRLGDEMILVRRKEAQGHAIVYKTEKERDEAMERVLRGEQSVPGKVIFTDPSLREELSKRRKLFDTACSSVVDSPEAQLKRAERDVLLGQAELLRQQAESIRIDNAAKRPPKAGA